jgi:lactoylglutathione lyase
MANLQRPFKVLGIQQIAIGGTDKRRLQKLWVDLLGLEVTGTFRSERENVDEDICAIGSGPFKQGLRFAPGGVRKGAAGFDICFVHPKANEAFPVAGEGVLIELVQAPPEVVEAFARLSDQSTIM